MTRARRPALHAFILAGGAGERFWPASRRRRPKPFLRVIGAQTLLEATLSRARRFAPPERVWIVCGKEHARSIRAASGLPSEHVLVEPERRNTAMAVAWAALRIRRDDPDALMAVLSADHHVPDERAFAVAIRKAARAAAGAEVLVTLGVRPTRPDTGYGYIALGRAAGAEYPGLHRVRRFVEKPDARCARRYLARGDHLWNAGVFVWRAATLLEEIAACAPELDLALRPLAEKPAGRNAAALHASYAAAPSLPIDVAVMEKSRRVWTLPVDFAWSDVGTWASLASELGVRPVAAVRPGRASLETARRGVGRRRAGGPDPEGNRVIAGDVLLEQAHSNLVWGGKRLIALLGVDDLAIVDTDDVILVTKLERSPDVRRLVAKLKKCGRGDLI